MLSVKHLGKTYRNSSVKAIDDINLEIENGDIFGFIGPNGAGKSTTIKCIVGIHGYDEGEIVFNGLNLKDNPLLFKSKLAYVPDNPDVYEFMTGIAYLDFIANIFKVGDEKNQLIHKYASMFGIEGALANPIKTYSHGMKQKITIMAALVHNPKVWILDEPLTGLDPSSIFQVKECMRLHAEAGNIVFFSSHLIDIVEKICGRIAIIKKGEIQCVKSIQEITDSGKTVEEFYMSIIDGSEKNE